MWNNGKDSKKGRLDEKLCKKLTLILGIIMNIVIIGAFILASLGKTKLAFLGVALVFIIVATLIFIAYKESKIKVLEQEEKEKVQIEKIFNKDSKIEVKVKDKYMYNPYYTEENYSKLEKLIFLHMLEFVVERSQAKYYAELCKDGEIVLYIVTEKKVNDITNIKEFDQFPYKMFLEYFEPVEK